MHCRWTESAEMNHTHHRIIRNEYTALNRWRLQQIHVSDHPILQFIIYSYFLLFILYIKMSDFKLRVSSHKIN